MKFLIIIVIALVLLIPLSAFGQEVLKLDGVPDVIVINEKTNKIYVSLSSTNKIAVIDGNTNQLETTINAGFQIAQMDINENTNKIYLSYTRVPPTLYELDGQTNIIQEIPNTNLLKQHNLDVLAMTSTEDFLPLGVTVNSQKNLIIFPTGTVNSWVGIMNADNFELKAIFKGIRNPSYIDVNDKTNQIYIISQYLKSLGVVDGNSLVTRSEVPLKTTIEFFKTTYYLTINEKTNTIYVSHGSHNLISIIDGVTNKIIGEIKVSGGAYRMDVDEKSNRLYVLSQESSSVKIIDLNSKEVIDEFSLPSKPRGVAYNSITKILYVGNTDGTLSIINTSDQNPPKLTVPSPITVETGNSNGKSVNFQVSATDDTDSDVEISCNPASGSNFEPGTTTVSCTAIDSSGRTSIERFTVTVDLDESAIPITSSTESTQTIEGTQKVTITTKTIRNLELDTVNSIVQKISKVLGNTEYGLDEPTIVPLGNDNSKTGYGIDGPDGKAVGGVNIWSNDNYVYRLEIATIHFNDDDSVFLAGVILAGLVKGAIDPNEIEAMNFIEMLTDAIGKEEVIKRTPSGHVVTASVITIIEGTPGLTMFVFNIDYKQEPTTISETKTITQSTGQSNIEKKPDGGGCLIATATYGSELAPQVQLLREIRDNLLLQTEAGTLFMNSFNDFYYSFSPVIADYERESPVFREIVKIAITPMISSLSLLNYVDMDSEIEVLGYGISLIILNGMMYVGIPAIIIMRIRK